MYNREFQKLSQRQQQFLLEWVEDNFTKSLELNFNWPAMEIKQIFSTLFFYVTRNQFVCAMKKSNFQVAVFNRDYVFNVHPKSKAFVLYGMEDK